MTQTPVKLTFEEYLTYDDGTDNRYELEDGVLILITPASPIHKVIINFLMNEN
jgi:Uma2 family endonuclease